MSKRAFRVLYRDFLFRVVDRELLSPHGTGDAHRLLTQIAAVLVLFSLAICIPAVDVNAGPAFSAPVRLAIAWRFVHFIIATTMLAVGLFAILSWNSMFPDHRDVAVLAPLPVAPRTILLAKVAAIVTALGFAVVAMHMAAGLAWPLALNRAAPPITMPSFTREPAISPVAVPDLRMVLDRSLAQARTGGWLAPDAGGGLAIAISQHAVRRVLTYGSARPDSIFQIGSVTKTFTAFALARMVQDGRVRLDTPVRELLPAVTALPRPAEPQREITLLDLATHRSGLPTAPPGVRPDRLRNPLADFGASDLYAYLRRRDVERPVDARFIYSNLGFGLLGHALALEAQTDFAAVLRQMVTEPLGLRDTAVSLTLEQRGRLLQGYDDEGQPVDPWEFDVLAGAGGMFSTAPDLLAWLEANLRPTGPLTPAFELTHQPHAAAPGDAQIGLAWVVDRAATSISHGGAVGGYTADAFLNRTDDLALVVLANRGPGVVATASRVAEHIRARLQGTPPLSLDDVVVRANGGVRSWLRTLVAYWLTMVSAGVFIAGSLIGVHGLAIALLPRHHFLSVSPFLQLTAFAVLVGGYLLQPFLFVADDLVAAQAGGPFSASPSYWFLGLYESLRGSPTMPVLATRAWAGLVVAIVLACFAYGVSYVRTLHGIAEEPDVTVAGGVPRLSFVGHGPTRALADFALKTLGRSTQPRVLMAFYWGFGFALAVAFARTPRGQNLATAGEVGAWHETSVPLLVASTLMMAASILAARNAFAMPRDLAANWIFRMLPLPDPRAYAVARHRVMLAISVAPVSVMSGIAFLWMWPWLPALGHVLALTLLGLTLLELVECGARSIPFTCSYLPGRSQIHVALVVVFLWVVPLAMSAATLEREALQDATLYGAMLGALAVALAAARYRTIWLARASDGLPAFHAEPENRAITLELWDSRFDSPTHRSPTEGRHA